jgi:hypothetical protein
MKGLVTGCSEIGNERNIQVCMELAVTHVEGSSGYFTDTFELERLNYFNIGGFGRPPYSYSVCLRRFDYTVVYVYLIVQCQLGAIV